MWFTKAKSNESHDWYCGNENMMSLQRCRLYDKDLCLSEDQEKMRFSPYDTESAEDFLAISAALGDAFLRPYASLMRISFSCGLVRPSKKEIADRKKFLDSMYIEFLTACGDDVVEPNKNGFDFIITRHQEGFLASIIKLIEEEDGGVYYSIYAFEIGSRIESFLQRDEADLENSALFSLSYSKYPDELYLLFDTKKIKTDDVIAVCGEVCKACGKELWLKLV